MGQVVSFSEFRKYYASIQGHRDFSLGTILDTNILIALSYESKSSHEETFDFFARELFPKQELGFRFFTTANTRSEFLDFNRRMIMTEHLRDMIDEHSQWKITTKAKAQIQYQSGQLKRREQQGGDPVFNDTQIKMIKAAFSAGRFSGKSGWLGLCEKLLSGQLDAVESSLEDLGIKYISQHESEQRDLFSKKIDWPDAKRIAEETCLGLADAMILNAFQCSRFPFVISADFDIGYAVLASSELKDVVMPDSVAKKYRDYHFDEYG
jgi:hypothetical protein